MKNDIMVDIETTGTDMSRNAIIQIAGVRFDYETGTLDTDNMFNRCLAIPGWRTWDLGTHQWWQKQGDVLKNIMSRAEDPRTVLIDFARWVNLSGDSPRLWAKPSHFEFPFISSYYSDFELPIPFGYRETVDLNSFMRGRFNSPGKDAFDKEIPMDGPAHDAIYDTIHQIAYALEIKKRALIAA